MYWDSMKLRTTVLYAVLACNAVLFSTPYAQPIYTFPSEIRKRNYVRVSTEKCDECVTLDDFYKDNRLGFLLFFERNLAFGHQYKDAVINGWIQVCEKIRWSRIACGMVDMVNPADRAYAERYIDPKTAPAHIVVRDSQPIAASKEQVGLLLKKPGDKDTMLEHVGLLLKDEGPLEDLLLSSQVTSKDALNRTMRKHRLVIAGFVGEDGILADAFRAAVQEAVFKHKLTDRLKQQSSSEDGRDGKGKAKKAALEKERSRIAYIAVRGKGIGRHFTVPNDHLDGSIAAFLDGELILESIELKKGSKNDEILASIKKVVVSGSVAAVASKDIHKSKKKQSRKKRKNSEDL